MNCNDGSSSMTARQFEETFCQHCKNRECVRAGWAFTAWDKRILSQVDRLLVNPNIVKKEDSSKWETLKDLESFKEPETIEVWGVATPPPSPKEDVVIITEPASPPPAPLPVVSQYSSGFNTAPQQVNFGEMTNPNPKNDPWSVTTTVAVGGKFKMG